MVACLSYNICFCVKPIPGKINVVAYFISRLQVERARLVQPCLEDQPTLIPIQWLPWHATPRVPGRLPLHRTVLANYEANWTRYVAFAQKLDRKRHYLAASPSTIIFFVQHLKEEGKASSTIMTCHCRKAQQLVATLTPQRINWF